MLTHGNLDPSRELWALVFIMQAFLMNVFIGACQTKDWLGSYSFVPSPILLWLNQNQHSVFNLYFSCFVIGDIMDKILLLHPFWSSQGTFLDLSPWSTYGSCIKSIYFLFHALYFRYCGSLTSHTCCVNKDVNKESCILCEKGVSKRQVWQERVRL